MAIFAYSGDFSLQAVGLADASTAEVGFDKKASRCRKSTVPMAAGQRIGRVWQ